VSRGERPCVSYAACRDARRRGAQVVPARDLRGVRVLVVRVEDVDVRPAGGEPRIELEAEKPTVPAVEDLDRPALSATKMRPSGAKRTAVGNARPLSAIVSWKPGGTSAVAASSLEAAFEPSNWACAGVARHKVPMSAIIHARSRRAGIEATIRAPAGDLPLFPTFIGRFWTCGSGISSIRRAGCRPVRLYSAASRTGLEGSTP
jgi:hypothetical protein